MRNICGILKIPLIVDADTGFGGPLQVHKTFRELEQAGAAAIQIENQVTDKKCGLLSVGHELVAKDAMLAKLRACNEARAHQDTMIIARTLAFSSEGLEGAIDRGRAYKDAGADALFVQVPGTQEQLRAVRAGIEGHLVLNMDESTEASERSIQEVEGLGFELALFPGSVRYAVVKAAGELLEELKESGSTRRFRGRLSSLAEYHAVLRMDEFFDLEKKLR